MYKCGPGRLVGIATSYGLDGPGLVFKWRERFSVHVQTSPVAHPASYTMDTWSLQGVKRPERCAYQHHPSSTKFEERIQLYYYFLMGIRGFFKGDLYFYLV